MSERVTQWTVEALETRSMLSAVFGPPSAVASSAQQSVIVDLDNDGVPDRVWAVNTLRDRRIGFEKGVGDGTFLAAGAGAVLSLPGTTSALVAGRFRGPTGGWQVASVGTYRDAGDVPGISRGLAVRVIDIGDVVGTLRVASRAFISWGRAVQVVTRVDALSGDVVSGEGQEIIVGASTIDEYPTGSAPVKRGRVTTHVLGLDSRERLNLLATPMDRTFVASRERFLGLRTQVADVNNDGRLDVLTRPLTFWRLHAGPILRA
ncbi:MAG: hypothetical protein K2Q20_12315, partial [Phycisphaerales bacterium]|nr:hypothetical protein [Phycisphaerales bacterium]